MNPGKSILLPVALKRNLAGAILDINPCLFNFGGSHHGGKKTLPDQLVQFKLIGER